MEELRTLVQRLTKLRESIAVANRRSRRAWLYLDEERRWFDLDAASTSSIGAMSITVLDTYSAMRRILLAPVADRVDLLRSMLEANKGMYRFHPGELDLVAVHLQSSGFPVDRDEERCLDALETLAAAGAWERMQRALDDALAVLLEATPGLRGPGDHRAGRARRPG